MKKIKLKNHLLSALAVGFFLLLAFGSDDTEQSNPQIKCGYCGKSFNKGEGYNTLMRIINTPENEYSHYCSRNCAEDFLRKN